MAPKKGQKRGPKNVQSGSSTPARVDSPKNYQKATLLAQSKQKPGAGTLTKGLHGGSGSSTTPTKLDKVGSASTRRADNTTSSQPRETSTPPLPAPDPENDEPRLIPASGRVSTTSPAHVLHGRVLKRWPAGIKRVSSRGLQNAHSWCYRNSTYQGLLHCPEVVNFLNSCSEQCRQGPENCSICALRRLCFAYWAKGRYFNVKLQGLNTQMDDVLKARAGGVLWESISVQQDAAEFLNHLLNSLEADTDRHEGAQLLSRSLFRSSLEVKQSCRDCGTTLSTSTNWISVFSLMSAAKLHEIVTLDSCLNNFFAEDQSYMSCSNNACPGHGKKESQRKGIIANKRFVTVPELLILALPVQADAGTRGQLEKRMTPCAYPEHVDLAGFASDRTDLTYTLQAVIAHIGTSINSGHYITVVREPNDSVSTASDTTIYRCTRASVSVRRLLSPVDLGKSKDRSVEAAQAYVLIYTKDAS